MIVVEAARHRQRWITFLLLMLMLLTIILLSVRVISSISPSILVVVVAVKERDWIGLDWPGLYGRETALYRVVFSVTTA